MAVVAFAFSVGAAENKTGTAVGLIDTRDVRHASRVERLIDSRTPIRFASAMEAELNTNPPDGLILIVY